MQFYQPPVFSSFLSRNMPPPPTICNVTEPVFLLPLTRDSKVLTYLKTIRYEKLCIGEGNNSLHTYSSSGLYRITHLNMNVILPICISLPFQICFWIFTDGLIPDMVLIVRILSSYIKFFRSLSSVYIFVFQLSCTISLPSFVVRS